MKTEKETTIRYYHTITMTGAFPIPNGRGSREDRVVKRLRELLPGIETVCVKPLRQEKDIPTPNNPTPEIEHVIKALKYIAKEVGYEVTYLHTGEIGLSKYGEGRVF